ncbi:TPA: hypothetical protein ROY30_004157 [Bacillus cereus]|uniref:XoxI protein n=1 Tax=Bacillus cereus TaxID=1396 RepID=A0A1D3N0Y5_BACCE|nr:MULTISPECIES: hypothetical protein [Bacillus]MCP1177895.1 hypothetical protein [Bacillus sp. 1663tsa1]MCP1283061.1 hypothetical protein [Bacillus sp. S0635]MCQ6347711.1 hypothetical protein [Bacillus cereus]MCU5459915.1 hypothetical protein [Bacillus cereus]MCU5751758.1 hypothetical protein [Bacillus cereus]
MKKKIIPVLLSSTFALGLITFAPSSQASANEGVSPVVHDNEKLPSKTFSPLPLDSKITNYAAGPHYSAKSGQYALGGTWSTSDSYTSSSKSKRKSIDRIYAKTKHYVDGGSVGSKADDQYNASHAGAEVNKGAWYIGDDEVYGEHIFANKGYQTWKTETYGS